MNETFDNESFRVAIAAAKWNEEVADALLDGAKTRLESEGVGTVSVWRCPGSYELPQLASKLAKEGSYDAIVCLGVLIRGETPHFDYISQEASRGIGAVGREFDLPVTFGVLTCDTPQQALARSDSESKGNKGKEAADAALRMIETYREIEAKHS